jgi:hypothetical protein
LIKILLDQGKELKIILIPQNLTCNISQVKPVTTCNTMSTGVVLPQVQIYKPIPAPVLPAGRIPQVNLYLCYTLVRYIGNTFLSPPHSIWTPVNSSGLHMDSTGLYSRKDYLWYASRVWVRVRVRLGLG